MFGSTKIEAQLSSKWWRRAWGGVPQEGSDDGKMESWRDGGRDGGEVEHDGSEDDGVDDVLLYEHGSP